MYIIALAISIALYYSIIYLFKKNPDWFPSKISDAYRIVLSFFLVIISILLFSNYRLSETPLREIKMISFFILLSAGFAIANLKK